MTVRLVQAWNGYPINALVTLDAATEAGLIVNSIAVASLTGGTNWNPNTPYDVSPFAYAQFNDATISSASSPSQNSIALQRAFNQGGSIAITQPGTYLFQTGAVYTTPVQSEIVVGAGVYLVDQAGAFLQLPGSAKQFYVTHVGKFGALGDGRYSSSSTVSCTVGTTTVTGGAGLTFVASDLGKRILITDAATTPTTAIAQAGLISFVNTVTNTATLSGIAINTVTNGQGVVVTDDRIALQNAVDSLGFSGGTVVFGPGIYGWGLFNASLVVPGGVTLLGQGIDFGGLTNLSLNNGVQTRGTTLLCVANQSVSIAMLRLGSNQTQLQSGFTAPRVISMNLDGGNVTDYAVEPVARRSRIYDSYVQRGKLAACHSLAQNFNTSRTVYAQSATNSCLLLDAATDNKIQDCEFRTPGNGAFAACIRMKNAAATIIQGNHMYCPTLPAGYGFQNQNIIAEFTLAGVWPGFQINNNQFNGADGHDIIVRATIAGAFVHNVQINDNISTATGFTNTNTNSFVSLETVAGSFINNIQAQDNNGRVDPGGGTTYKSIINYANAGNIYGLTLRNNKFQSCGAVENLTSGSLPEQTAFRQSGNQISADASTGTYTTSDGNGVFATTGSAATTYSWSHNLAGTPRTWNVTPNNLASSAGPAFYTVSATQITATITLPGVVPLSWTWTASL